MNAHGIEIKLICYADPCLIDDHIIKRYPGNYDYHTPGGEFFFDVIEKIVLSNFLKGLDRFKNLLRRSNTREITICYDALGVFKSNSGYAGYCTNHEGSANGSHLFFVHPPLLVEYTTAYWEKSKLKLDAEYVWDGLLTKMLDCDNIKIITPADNCIDGKEIFIEQLLNLRAEGIADLTLLFKGDREKRKMDLAKSKFRALLNGISKDCLKKTNPIADDIRNQFEKYNYYLIGTWMILHIIGCCAIKGTLNIINGAIEEHFKGDIDSDPVLYGLIQSALKIDNNTFLSLLTSPGIDGLPFVEESLLSEAAAVFSTLSLLQDTMEVSDDDAETMAENLANSKTRLSLFNEFWGDSHVENPARQCR